MGRPLTQSEIELILSFYPKTKGNARATSRELYKEPYLSKDLHFSYPTVLKYWRRAKLPIRGRGGPNHVSSSKK